MPDAVCNAVFDSQTQKESDFYRNLYRRFFLKPTTEEGVEALTGNWELPAIQKDAEAAMKLLSDNDPAARLRLYQPLDRVENLPRPALTPRPPRPVKPRVPTPEPSQDRRNRSRSFQREEEEVKGRATPMGVTPLLIPFLSETFFFRLKPLLWVSQSHFQTFPSLTATNLSIF